MDPHHEKLAQVIVRYSLDLKPGQLVRIRGNVVAAPLIRRVGHAALKYVVGLCECNNAKYKYNKHSHTRTLQSHHV